MVLVGRLRVDNEVLGIVIGILGGEGGGGVEYCGIKKL